MENTQESTQAGNYNKQEDTYNKNEKDQILDNKEVPLPKQENPDAQNDSNEVVDKEISVEQQEKAKSKVLETPFTDDEFSIIIHETQKGFNAKSVVDMDKKVATKEQLLMLAGEKSMGPAHKLKVMTNMNVKEPAKTLMANMVETKKVESGKTISPQLAQKVSQNIKNLGKGMSID